MVEELIYKVLQSTPGLAEHTAQYCSKPAIFFQQSPHDQDQKWSGGRMFPRMVYDVNWRYHPERKTDGSMNIDLFCNNESEFMPEQLAKNIVSHLSELFLTDESGTYCLLWDRTDSSDMQGPEPLVCGASIAFDIVRYPVQEGASPCPVWAVNQFIKQMQPACVLIGHDLLPQELRATAQKPIVYTKMVSARNLKTTFGMAWMQMDIAISVLSSNVEERRKWVTAILRDLSMEQEAVMQNGSPYLIMNITEETANDPVQTGQILLSGQYGVMRQMGEGVKLHNAHFKKEG